MLNRLSDGVAFVETPTSRPDLPPMPTANSIRLVGNVAGRAILQEIGGAETGSGFAKLVMHQPTHEDMLAIARAVH